MTDFSIAARLTPELANDFVAVPGALMRHMSEITMGPGTRGLNSSDVIVIIQILSFKWTNKNPYPSLKSLALRAGLSERQVRNIIRSLEEDFKVLRRIAQRGRKNKYDLSLLFQKLEELQRHD